MRVEMPGFDPGFTVVAQNPPPVAVGPMVLGSLAFPELLACMQCTARAEATRVVPGVGPTNARLMVIGQNPGEDEDRAGVPFIGAGGQELDRWLQLLGLDRAKLVVTNIVKCHTRDNRVPRPKEIKTCRDAWLARELGALPDLRVLLPVGKPAVSAVLGKDAPPMTPLAAHHYRVRIDGRDFNVFPLPHPAFLLRAQHLAPLFRETILTHVRMTLEAECPDAYQFTRRGDAS